MLTEWKPPRNVYVFLKPSCDEQILIPNRKYVAEKLVGTNVNGRYFIMLAEIYREASKAPKHQFGADIVTATGRCPTELHVLRRATAPPRELDVDRISIKTAHPL